MKNIPLLLAVIGFVCALLVVPVAAQKGGRVPYINKWVVNDSGIYLFQTTKGRSEKVSLEVSKGWSPGTPPPEYALRFLAQHNKQVLVVMLNDQNSGTAARRAPAFYRLVGTQWKLTNPDLRSYQFSNWGGGFHLSRDQKRLDVWEVENYDGTRRDPHRYRLNTFIWSRGRFHKTSSRLTRKHYTPQERFEKEKPILRKNDPLREFGRRWSWWQSEWGDGESY